MSTLNVVEWLKSLPAISKVSPIQVEFDGKTFLGAKYRVTLEYTEGMTAVTSGKVKAGTKYHEERFYLLGNRPFKIKGKRRFCFPYNGEEWYISSYYEGNEKNEYHPFGTCFMMGQWGPFEDGTKIDTYEKHPYLRVLMKVSEK